MSRLANKIILITGAAGAVGSAVAGAGSAESDQEGGQQGGQSEADQHDRDPGRGHVFDPRYMSRRRVRAPPT